MVDISEIFIIVLLILMNGFFSMAEFALVSAKRIRLEQMADNGFAGAATAIRLSEDPNTLLSAIQIGITLISILTGVYSGAAIAGELSLYLSPLPLIGQYSDNFSMILVVLVISYFTLVFGELVPKRLGLGSPERIAAYIARPVEFFVQITRPVTWITALSTDLVFRFLENKEKPGESVAEEEISVLLEEGTRAGEFDEKEQEIVKSVFRFGDQQIASLMIPRPDIIALDLGDSSEENLQKMIASGHTRYPVCKNGLDTIVGVLSIRDLWADMVSDGEVPDLESCTRDVLIVPEQMSALSLLEQFKNAQSPLSVLVDEYGSVVGIVTLHDLMEALVGDLSSGDRSEEPPILPHGQDSWFVDGMVHIEELKSLLDLKNLPGEDEGFFRTVAGYVMAELGKIPTSGDSFIKNGYRFEVVDMDAHRVDKILITKVVDPAVIVQDPK